MSQKPLNNQISAIDPCPLSESPSLYMAKALLSDLAPIRRSGRLDAWGKKQTSDFFSLSFKDIGNINKASISEPTNITVCKCNSPLQTVT